MLEDYEGSDMLEDHKGERLSQGRDYHDAMMEASVRRIESKVTNIAEDHIKVIPRVDQLERSVFGYSVGTAEYQGLERQFNEALPNLRKVNTLIKAVNVLIVGLIPTLGALLLYFVSESGLMN